MTDKDKIAQLERELKDIKWIVDHERAARHAAERRFKTLKTCLVALLEDVFVKQDKK